MTLESGHRRRSIRLKDFDYARGAVYFLTLCTDARRCIFGRIENGHSRLNRLGRIVEDEWLGSLEMRRYLDLDAYVVMPNHFHAIAALFDQGDGASSGGQGARSAPLRADGLRNGMQARSLASFVAGFKAAVSRRARKELPRLRFPVWQRNYYEHVVRDGRDLGRIRDYVAANPARWEEDGYHPNRLAGVAGTHGRAPRRAR